MRRLILRIGMLLMGIGLVGGAVATQIGTALAGLDQQVGTNGSAAAFVLGAGLIVASLSPSAPIAWVRAGILYGDLRPGFHPAADRGLSRAQEADLGPDLAA
ncbi:MAG: hypothetical protein E6I06_12695 [Chloroflexi bacterium]|nr:MAG: hypothetical protein E6I06_12695 [Chloroflexota bacterium]